MGRRAEQQRRVLLSYVPRHVAEEVLLQPADSPIGREQRREAVTLFADISGFTSLSERLGRVGKRGTEQLSELLNRYFGTLIDVVDSHGGSVGKFGGDALTVLFPLAHEGPAITALGAIQCALEMQERTRSYSEIDTIAGTFGLGLKIGLAKGPVFCASVGEPGARTEYVIAGKAVDRCAEAEHRAGEGEVVATEDLARLCPQAIVAERSGGFTWISGISEHVHPTPAPPLRDPSPESARTLEAYLHPAIAARVRSGLGSHVNEHRNVAVLFVRFEGFDYDDADVLPRLQGYVLGLVQTVRRFDGHLRQIDMGDKGSKALIVFGAPIAHENDEERALRCALELQVAAGDELRIGVSSGFAFCGETGSPKRRDYSVVGDVVNTAARLMQAAEQGQIVVAGSPRPRIRRLFDHAELQPLALKGKAEPVQVFTIRGIAGSARTVSALEERPYDIPMVGRDEELGIVRSVLEAAVHGEGQIIAITGEPGIGKSRFTAELVRQALDVGFACHGGACDSSARRTSYFVWQDIWRSFFALDANAPTERQVRRLEEELDELEPGLARRLPLLAPTLSLAIPDNPVTRGLDAELRAELLHSLLRTCLASRAAFAPTLFLLEDGQWIDPLSLELLARLGRGLEHSSVALVVVHRPRDADRGPTHWAESLENFTPIALDPLTEDAVERLLTLKLRQLFGHDMDVPASTLRHLVERAGGNAFYLEELLNLLRDRGIDPRDAKTVAAGELPDTLHSLVMARIDRLPPEEQATLKVASVVGRLFKAFWIWGSYPPLGEPGAVRARLDRLSGLELISLARPDPELEYLFNHVVTHDVAYESLAFSLREELHGRIGHFIETTYAGKLDAHVYSLADHYGKSRDTAKQRTYFRRAADAAKAAFANDTAVEYYQRLLELTGDEGRSDIMRSLGEVWQLVGSWSEAEAAFREAVALATAAGDDRATARACSALGNLVSHRGSADEADELLQQALAEFERIEDRGGAIEALEHLAFNAWQRSSHEASLDYSRKHLALAEAADDPVGICMAVEQMGLTYWHRGQHDLAEASFEHALEVARRVAYTRGVIHASNDYAGLLFELGRYEQALERVREGLVAAEEIGYRFAAAALIGNAGELYRLRGDLGQALSCYDRGLRIAAELRDWTGISKNAGNIALALVDLDRIDEGERLFGIAIELARSVETLYHLCEYLHHLAALQARRNRPEEARRTNDEALAIATEIERRDVLFAAEVLAVRLRLILGTASPTGALRELERLGERWPEPRQLAALSYERWRIDIGDETSKGRAANLYEELFSATPDHEFLLRYRELTGRDLPEQPPLSPLLDEGEVDVKDIVRLLESLRQELPGVALAVA